jgi:hypothetical protein
MGKASKRKQARKQFGDNIKEAVREAVLKQKVASKSKIKEMIYTLLDNEEIREMVAKASTK